MIQLKCLSNSCVIKLICIFVSINIFKVKIMKTMNLKWMLMLAVMLIGFTSCNEDDPESVMPEIEKNTINFTIEITDSLGTDLLQTGRANNICGLLRVKYNGKTYFITDDSRSQGEESLTLTSVENGCKKIVFGGIDGTKEYTKESFTIDCADGKKQEVTFSNRIIEVSGETRYVRTYALNGEQIEEPTIKCEYEFIPYNVQMVGGFQSYVFDFEPIDKNGNDLLLNDKFCKLLKENTTFTFRGKTSKIVLSETKEREEYPKPEDMESSSTFDTFNLYFNTHYSSDGSHSNRIKFGQFISGIYYIDQILEINWFDGTKDVVTFTLVNMPSYYTDPTSELYNPSMPLAQYELYWNGERVKHEVQHAIMSFTMRKTFEWTE